MQIFSVHRAEEIFFFLLQYAAGFPHANPQRICPLCTDPNLQFQHARERKEDLATGFKVISKGRSRGFMASVSSYPLG